MQSNEHFGNFRYSPVSLSGQKGFSTLGLILTLTFIIAALAKGVGEMREAQLRDSAAIVGSYIAQYNSAVGDYVDDVRPTLPNGTTTYTGVSWLKDSACTGGTASRKYLTCNFPDFTRFNLQPTTVVVSAGGNITATTSYGVLQHGGGYHGVYSNIAVSKARKKLTKGLAAGQLVQIAPSNELQSIVDTSTATDAWWRIDGTNTPTADLSVANNSFTDVNCVDFNGSNLCRNGAGNLTFGGANVAGIGNLITNNINNAGNVNTGTLNGRDLTARDEVTASQFVDRDNPAYRVDPRSNSNVRQVDANDVLLSGTYSEGAACNNKEVGTDSIGRLLFCVSGRWERLGLSVTSATFSRSGRTPILLGNHNFCAISYFGNGANGNSCHVYESGGQWYKQGSVVCRGRGACRRSCLVRRGRGCAVWGPVVGGTPIPCHAQCF